MFVIPIVFRYGAAVSRDPKAEWLTLPCKFMTWCLLKWRPYCVYTNQVACLVICLFFLSRVHCPLLTTAVRDVAAALSVVNRDKPLFLKQAGVLRARWGRAGEGRSAPRSLQWGHRSWKHEQRFFSPLCPGDLRTCETAGCSNSGLEMFYLDSFYNGGYKENQGTGRTMPN